MRKQSHDQIPREHRVRLYVNRRRERLKNRLQAIVLLQGTSLPVVARWLGLEAALDSTPEYLLRLESPDSIRTGLAEITISSTSAAAKKQIVDLKLPKGVLVMMVSRNQHAFIPTGRSILQAHDKLLVFADGELLATTMKIMEAYDPHQIPGPRGDVV